MSQNDCPLDETGKTANPEPMYQRIAILLSCLLACLTAPLALAETISKQEQLFRKAMVPDSSEEGQRNGNRAIDPGKVIRAYIKSGHVRQKPDLAADYVDHRKFKKAATLFGHKLITIEEEYFVKFIGCCVNPGIGAIIEVNGSTAELDAYLAANKCRTDFPRGPEDTLKELKFKTRPGAIYHHVRCRQNDIFATQ
jgi:hypothetical protein